MLRPALLVPLTLSVLLSTSGRAQNTPRFAGPTDTVLEAMGRSRHVALSTPGFLVVPRIVASSDMIAVVPARIVREERERLQVFDPPIGVPGFELAMLWHDRTTTHPVQRWVRERFVMLLEET